MSQRPHSVQPETSQSITDVHKELVSLVYTKDSRVKILCQYVIKREKCMYTQNFSYYRALRF